LHKRVVHVGVGLLRDLVDQPDLEQLVDHLEHELLGEEVVIVLAHTTVYAVERKAVLLLFELARDEDAKLLALVLDRVDVILSC